MHRRRRRNNLLHCLRGLDDRRLLDIKYRYRDIDPPLLGMRRTAQRQQSHPPAGVYLPQALYRVLLGNSAAAAAAAKAPTKIDSS